MAKGSIFGALEGSRLDLDYEQCLDRCVALWNASVTRDMFSRLVIVREQEPAMSNERVAGGGRREGGRQAAAAVAGAWRMIRMD